MEPKKVTPDQVDRLLEKCEEAAQKYTGDFAPEKEGLGEVLRRDPVAEAERILGRKVTDNGVDALVALGHAFRVNEYKNRKLVESDDTTISNTVERYHRIIGEMGFEKVLEIPFASRQWPENQNEKLFLFWRQRGGLLLKHDTFGLNVNGGNVYFNWRPNRYENIPERASGGFHIRDGTGHVPYREIYPNGEDLTTDPLVLKRLELWNEKWEREAVWVGNTDCREGIRYWVENMEKTGTFVTPWEVQPWMWLLNYDEGHHDHQKYLEINEQRIAMLPEHVRKAITPTVHA